MSEKIKRYHANAEMESDGWQYVAFEEAQDGEYCRWDDVTELQQINTELLRALEAVWGSGVDDIDPRIDYLEVQIDRDDWAAVGATIAKARGGGDE